MRRNSRHNPINTAGFYRTGVGSCGTGERPSMLTRRAPSAALPPPARAALRPSPSMTSVFARLTGPGHGRPVAGGERMCDRSRRRRRQLMSVRQRVISSAPTQRGGLASGAGGGEGGVPPRPRESDVIRLPHTFLLATPLCGRPRRPAPAASQGGVRRGRRHDRPPPGALIEGGGAQG